MCLLLRVLLLLLYDYILKPSTDGFLSALILHTLANIRRTNTSSNRLINRLTSSKQTPFPAIEDASFKTL